MGAFFISTAVIALLSVRGVVGHTSVLQGIVAPIVGGTLLVGLATGRDAVGEWKRHLTRANVKELGLEYEVLLFCAGSFVTVLVAAFPAPSPTATTTTNLFSHFLGFAMGFLAAYIPHHRETFWNTLAPSRTR